MNKLHKYRIISGENKGKEFLGREYNGRIHDYGTTGMSYPIDICELLDEWYNIQKK